VQLDQILQGNNVYVLLGVCCCGLCIIGVVLSVVMPFLDIVMGLAGMVIDFAGMLFQAGPVPGCGCVVVVAFVVAVLVVGLLMTSVLSGCGTPQATNFCTLFGR
jgi:hypothetical protein